MKKITNFSLIAFLILSRGTLALANPKDQHTQPAALKPPKETTVPITGSVEVSTPEMVYTSCTSVGQPLLLRASDYSLAVTRENGGTELCLARVRCNLAPHLPKHLAEQYPSDSWVACLPEKGGCTKTYTACKDDSGLSYIDMGVAHYKIARALGIDPAKDLAAAKPGRVIAWESGFQEACESNLHRFCGPQATCGNKEQLGGETTQTLKQVYPTLESFLSEARPGYREGQLAGKAQAQELRKASCKDSRVLGEVTLKPLPEALIEKYKAAGTPAARAE